MSDEVLPTFPAPASEKATSGLRIRLFGPMEVRIGSDPLPRLRSRKGLWLLALLALRDGREVERDWLAGTLWPECSEVDARRSLRQSLHDLRLALGPESWRLTGETARTLRLDVTGAFVDVLAFDAAMARGAGDGGTEGVGTGGAKLRGRSPGEAQGGGRLGRGADTGAHEVGGGGRPPGAERSEVVRSALEEAVGLYRGRLLEDCTEDWVPEERGPREQAYVAALERLAAAATAREEYDAASRFLRLAIAADAYREDLHLALMETLAAGGSPAAALLVYRQFRSLLWREMSAEPNEATTALFRRLREETHPHPRSPTPLRAVPPSPFRPEGTRLAASPALPPTPPRRPLPLPLTELIGREEAVPEVVARLAQSRLVTLTGTGGIGKTRLALQVAAKIAEEYADGAAFVNLAPLTDPERVPDAVRTTLGVSEATGVGDARQETMEVLRQYLSSRDTLLVLDNCEHLLNACATLAVTLLSACASVRILATSRQALGVEGETVWRVPPLSLPEASGVRRQASVDNEPDSLPRTDALRLTPDAWLLHFAAVQLFVERARAAESSFEITPQNAPAIAQVCRRLDGIPLAIELAAARVRAMPVEIIAARLDERFHLLTGGSRTALPRQQTLRASIDWSYDLLPERERLLMRRLSVFAGGWTLQAAEAVCGEEGVGRWALGLRTGDCSSSTDAEQLSTPQDLTPKAQGLTPDAVLDLLTSLVDKSLVVYEARAGEGRYHLLETLRQYAGDRLREEGTEATLRGRHLNYYLAMAEEAEAHLTGTRQREWLERLEIEHDNLRAALDWSRDQLAVGSWQLAVGSEEPRSSADTPHRQLPTANCQLPTGAEAGLRLAGALGRFWNSRGYLTEGRERLSQALASAPGATPDRAKALETAGLLAYLQADYERARALHEESLTIRRELGDRRGIAASLRNLGVLTNSHRDPWTARSLYEESLALSREVGDPLGIAASLRNLGAVAYQLGEYGAACSLHEESLAIRRELGDRLGIADSLRNLGVIAHRRGEYEVARSLHEEGLAIKRELGDRLGIAASLKNLGQIAYSKGEYEVARSLYEEGLSIRRESGDRSGIAATLNNLGRVAYAQGKYGEARSLYEECLAIRRELGNRPNIPLSLRSLGMVASIQGEYEEARSLYEQSLALCREFGDRLGIAASLEGLAELACQRHGRHGTGEGAGGIFSQAEAAEAEGAGWHAARLFGAAEALREAIGAPLPPNQQEVLQPAVSRVREMLEAEAFAAAWEEGRAMPLDEAIDTALRGSPR